jgi:hypothetical protein
MAGSLFSRLNGNHETEFEKIHMVDSLQLNELKLHARMFYLSYHTPARYEAVLERIVLSFKT